MMLIKKEEVLEIVRNHKVKEGKKALIEKLESVEELTGRWDKMPASKITFCSNCRKVIPPKDMRTYCPVCESRNVRGCEE